MTYDAATAARRGRAARQAPEGAHRRSRHEADPGALQDTTDLTGLTTFLGVAALLSAFVAVTVTATAFGLSVAQRRRDLALLRTIGATPAQVMRTICAEAALVGAGGSAAGCLLGLAGAPRLAAWIVRQGLAPSWFKVDFTPGSVLALVVAFLAGIAVAMLSVLVAAVRAGTIRPTEALREAAVEPKRPAGPAARRPRGAVRRIAALAAVALVFPAAATDPRTEAEIVILLIGGAALLSPILLSSLSRRSTAVRPGCCSGQTSTGPRRAAAAMSGADHRGPDRVDPRRQRHRQRGGERGGAPAGRGCRLRRASGWGTRSHHGARGPDPWHQRRRGNRRDGHEHARLPAASHLASPGIPVPVPYQAIGVDRPSAALNLTVTAGTLGGLDDQTIAVDSSWDKHVGDTMSLGGPTVPRCP